MRAHRNVAACGCSYPSLDGHVANAVGWRTEQVLAGLIRSVRKAHLPGLVTGPAEVYRDAATRGLLEALAAARPPVRAEQVLDVPAARAVVMLAHSRTGLAVLAGAAQPQP